MRHLNTIMLAGVMAALTACGSKSSDSPAPAAAPSPAALNAAQPAALTAQLPAGIIARVPADANGNPTGSATIVGTSATAGTFTSGTDIITAYNSGTTPAGLASTSELDKTTSTQSWSHGGYGYGGYGSSYGGYGGYGYGNSWSYGYGGNSWTYGYGGYNSYNNYSYGYNSYNYGGYNYYCYYR